LLTIAKPKPVPSFFVVKYGLIIFLILFLTSSKPVPLSIMIILIWLFSLIISINIFFSKFTFAADKTVDPNLIHKNLRCLVCQGQSISDSNSDFAQTIKLVVKDLIDEGKTEDEIYEFMSDKYGDWIVFKPQFNTQNSLLWILPYIALIFGGFFIFSFLKKRQ